jgi:hypothetical protein
VEERKFYIVDLKNDLPVIFLLLVILLSFIGGYFSSIYRPVYYATSLISVFFVYFLVLQKSVISFKISSWIFYAIYIIISITFFLIFYQSLINTYHVYLIFATGLYVLFNQYHISRKSLLHITNISFFIYLFFSILLYLGYIQIGRELNIFEVSYNFLGIKTFIGLFGSTASIDSYATIIIFINLYYNKGKSKWLIIFIAGLAALLTFRSTPYLVFFGPFIIVKTLDLFRRNQILLFLSVAGIFLIGFIPSALQYITGDEKYVLFLDLLLTGRASLWILMLEKYFTYPVFDLLMGFGDTIYMEVFVWGKLTANPHNMYLKLLIVYGVFLFIGSIFLISLKFKKNTFSQLIILFAILLAGVGNSNIFSFMNVPLTIWFIALINPTRKNFDK